MKKGFNFETKNGLYVDLDSLYDTRLAIIEAIDLNYSKYLLATTWNTRVEDKFPFIDDEAYKLLWKNRESDLLETALPTGIFDIIFNFFESSIRRQDASPYNSSMNIFVNIWPYKLTKYKASQYLKNILALQENSANVAIINTNPNNITAKWCRENLSCICMYDYQDWLESNTNDDEGFKKYTIPDVDFYVPALYFNKRMEEAEELDYIRRHGSPFRALEKLCKPIISLVALPISNFNAVLPNDVLEGIKKEYAGTKLDDS